MKVRKGRKSVGRECPDEFRVELAEKVRANNSALSLGQDRTSGAQKSGGIFDLPFRKTLL